MVRFIEFERLELNDREITFQIRNVKWGTKIEFGKVPITRGNCVCYSINHIIVKSVGCPALSFCNGEKICFFLQGDCHEDDNEIKNYWLSTTEEASEIYETLLSMATNAEDFTDSPQLQGYIPEKICIDKLVEPQNKSAWEHFYLNTKSPSLYDLRTPPKSPRMAMPNRTLENYWANKRVEFKRVHDYINELMDAKKARDYMGVYSGMGLGSDSVQTEGFDYTQGVIWQALKELRKQTPVFSMDWGSNDIPKAKNKIKGEEKMKIVKRENLTVAQALEKFNLDTAYIKNNGGEEVFIGYYDSKETVDFNVLEGSNTLKTTDYNKETQIETTYFIENADEFIQKLNALKPFDPMVMIEKYAEKPKFTLGEKVIYSKTDVNLNSVENDYPEALKKQILQKRIEDTKQIGIITRIQYDGGGAITYKLLTSKYGELETKVDNLSYIKE